MPTDHSVDTIYTRATNPRGFSTQARTNFPPDIMEAVSALVATRKTPYRTNADLIRDAVQHRVFYWEGLVDDEGFLAAASITRRLAEAELRTSKIIREEALLETRTDQLQRVNRDRNEVQAIINEIDDDIQTVSLSYVRDGLISLIDRYNT